MSRRAINFDLDTNTVKQIFGNTRKGYKVLKDALLKEGFIHRQWSGYISKDDFTDAQILKIVKHISIQNPWLSKCVKRFDITEIGKIFDAVGSINKYASKSAVSIFGTNKTAEKSSNPNGYSQNLNDLLSDMPSVPSDKANEQTKTKMSSSEMLDE